VDLVGVSFYPFYDTKATLSNLKSSLTALIGQINKDIMVAETDWPQACSGGPTLSEKAPGVGVSGQQMWISSIKNVLTALPNGRGVGIRECRASFLCEVDADNSWNFSLLGAWMDRQRQPRFRMFGKHEPLGLSDNDTKQCHRITSSSIRTETPGLLSTSSTECRCMNYQMRIRCSSLPSCLCKPKSDRSSKVTHSTVHESASIVYSDNSNQRYVTKFV
jgi:hypothetical protein